MTESEKFAVGYARVSTVDQNLDMQIAAIKKHGVPDHLIFTDKMSGASQKRPGLDEAIRSSRRSGAEFVVWKLDRLGRTMRGIIDTMHGFERDGVRLVSLTENFDLGTPMGKGMFHIMAALAQMERDLIRERTMAGLKAAKERGEAHGRPQTMTPERVDKARELVLAGKSPMQILHELQAIEGPRIGRSRVYQWVKDFKSLSPVAPVAA
ncbi:recombinase family protein [Leisingera sp. F5]|uniref:recombinase family protein n=1 Tax=Leisingera sp. F5 TaxID=1813816 RepID=UPI000AABFD26|nr:recombinase family protein [Leisingera sp. F5]